MEHIGNIKIPLYEGLVSLHFREYKANLLTHEHVKKCCIQPTNQPTSIISCGGRLGSSPWKMCHTFSIPFPAHKDEEKDELAHDEHTLSTQYTNCHSMEGACVCYGPDKSRALVCPLTSKVHCSRSGQDAGTNYSAWYDTTEKLKNQTYTNWLKPSGRMAPPRANQAQSILGRVKCSVVHSSVNFVYLKFFFLHLNTYMVVV